MPHPKLPRPRSVATSLSVGLLVLALGAPAPAQAPATKAVTPLSKYVPREGLWLYVEFAGLDAHAAAWQKTAAYHVLNKTTAGAMIEELAIRLADKALAAAPFGKMNGAEAITLAKHLAQSGFILASGSDPKDPKKMHSVWVFRGAYRPHVKGAFSKLLGVWIGANPKTEQITKGTRKVVQVTKPDKTSFVFWVEKDDVVFAQGNVDAIVNAISGLKPDATNHPLRVALNKPEEGFQPVGIGFIDVKAFPNVPSEAGKFFEAAGVKGVERLDYRWGFQDKALMSVARVVVPKPRQGLLALLDQPAFSVKTLPPMPKEVENFTAFSADPKAIYDQFVAMLPERKSQIEAFEKSFKDKTRLKFRDEILGRLGPKMSLYLLPTKRPGTSPLTSLTSVGVQVPRFVLLVEMSDPAAFSKSLNELMFVINRELAAAMPQPPAVGPDGAPTERPARKAPVPEFRLSPSPPKTFMLNLPEHLAALTNLRLSISVGEKYLAIASAADVAKEAVLQKDGASLWTPKGEYAGALDKLGQNLLYLQVEDPRESLPLEIVGLPANLQKMSAALAAQSDPARNPFLAAAPSGRAGPSGYPGYGSGSSVPGAAYISGASGYPDAGTAYPGGSSGSGGPPIGMMRRGSSGSGYPGYGSGGQGEPGDGGAGPSGEVTFQVAPAKIPKAEAIKGALFPGFAALAVDGREVRFTMRESFPNFNVSSLAQALPTWLAAREAARQAEARKNPAGRPGAPAGDPANGEGNAPTASP